MPPPWCWGWLLLHPFAFERGYPGRPLATMPVDFDPAAPAPNRLVARLRARHAVREAAAFPSRKTGRRASPSTPARWRTAGRSSGWTTC